MEAAAGGRLDQAGWLASLRRARYPVAIAFRYLGHTIWIRGR